MAKVDSTRPKVLVVEDDENVRRLIGAYFRHEGFAVVDASDGKEALDIFAAESPDAVLLDVMLPGMDGWSVCRRLRGRSRSVPIIMLSARGAEDDRIKGFEFGADDYVTKPFSPRELVLRVRAVLRRAGGAPAAEGSRLHYPDLEIDRRSRRCLVAGRPVDLTRREFDLLWHLARHPGQALERDSLLQHVWGYDFDGDRRTVDVHVTRLRDKLEAPGGRKYLHTVWGVGYKFEAIPAAATPDDAGASGLAPPGSAEGEG